jgi:deazaflavin-dependent oxidoreductase (nitroreductase family)
MSVTDHLARFNRRFINHAVAPFAGRRLSPVAAVVHRGRRTGHPYRTPVLALRHGDGWVIALPYGADRDWVRNVRATGGCVIHVGGRAVETVDPRLVSARTVPALRLLPIGQALRLTTRLTV